MKKNAMHCRLRGKPNPNYSSSQMSIKPQMPLQTFAVFWRNTEKSEAAMSLLWSADVLLVLDSDGKIGLCMQWNSILNESFLNVVSHTFFFNDLMWLKGLLLLKYIDGGCSYRETWFPSLSLAGCVLCHRVLARIQTSTLFICSLRLGVDTEKPRFQMAALNTWLLNLEFLLTWSFFSVLLEAPECCTEKLWSTSAGYC